ncbi:hypothetical protein RJZ56_002987 [Blastomyces dermatitidis]|uniref:Proteinase T n=3 Tax=Blastomyces TaxID=229219 RepID=A0A179UGG9_BLAGS|nr:proteinase T [Blastomyces gilchristii SLH14081]XP_045278750.1 proteinase T [Blastomyces dermatitidis ER-3]EGE84041.1 proteinase T [Blastomyces dermatitidis ATCC 18188]EQL35126.1 hypothetical protein BDFG_03112 [Blastomyces dermatitidis ATCC 26199]EEQ92425.1 proteinase T [Blastomyces dermatitidis ER-3]OAT07135.1 proteinase T [Blastomyces gilchristii SLH14081]
MHFFDTILPLALVVLSTADAAAVLKVPRNSHAVPNSYIVVMKPGTSDDRFESHRSWVSNKLSASDSGVDNGGVRHDYNLDSEFKAYSGIFGEDVIKQISNDEDVAYIEPDIVVKLDKLRIQKNASSWGLGRISSTKPGSPHYIYDEKAGEGITAYVIDTGIDVNHPDFDGRATWGTNTVDSRDEDCGNHGTHVAGTIGGNRHGVAKKIKLIGVKVFGCDEDGGGSNVIRGMAWAYAHATHNGDPKKSIMNMSLGAPYSRSFNEAAAAIVRAGIFLAVSAGNDGFDASKKSPASEPTVCTIGATDSEDTIAKFSNYGSGVDLFAPGVDIVSTVPGGKTDSYSGTSMAAPHAAGVAAYLMAIENISGGAVCDRLKELARDSVKGAPEGTTRKLLFNGVRRHYKSKPRKKVPKRPEECPPCERKYSY